MYKKELTKKQVKEFIGDPGVKELVMDPELFSTVQKISMRRAKKIETLMQKHIPKWKIWLMKNNKKLGYLLGYRIELKPEFPSKNQLFNESITLIKRDKKIAGTNFSIKDDSTGQKLLKLVPEMQKYQNKDDNKPNYIG